jgi:SAM-dependent methyltransferase
MVDYNRDVVRWIDGGIPSFIDTSSAGADSRTVDAFGEEWTKFHDFAPDEIEELGAKYFDLVAPILCPGVTKALDVGCGAGRWTSYLAGRVGFVEAIDPSDAVRIAHNVNSRHSNVRVTHAGVSEIPFPDASFDLVVALGVLHHIPDTREALRQIAMKARDNGHVLVYLYYSFENRGPAFRVLHKLSELVRHLLSRAPQRVKEAACELIAIMVYLPLARLAKALRLWLPGSHLWRKVPLSFYADRSLYVMRNDALDRFGTPLEQRFAKAEIVEMMENAGLVDIQFSDSEPYWCAVGRKAGGPSPAS